MIRFAILNDISDIIGLWNEAFGDSESEIRFFLDNKFIAENTLVYELNGKIISMLFLLDGNFVINNISYPSYYLYAACTSEICRGKGIMAKLLEYAKKIAAERAKCFICLMPGEESLYKFYEKFGYKTVFSRKIIKVDLSVALNERKSFFGFNEITLYEKRVNAFKNFDRFEWDNNSIDFACKHHLLYSGRVKKDCKGYALYSLNADRLFLKEFAYNVMDFAQAVEGLLADENVSSADISLPVEYQTETNAFKIIPNGMALATDFEFESLLEKIDNAYLGLTLD